METYDEFEEILQSPDEFQEYVNKLWSDHAELEQELEVERKGHDFDIRVLEHEFLSKIEWVKHKTSVYTQGLEAALNEVKLK